MSRTFKWPLEIDSTGRIQIMDDSEESKVQALKQLIILSIFPSKTTNPWLRWEGIGMDDWTFKQSYDTIPKMRRRVMEVFDNLESNGRARLLSVDFGEDLGGKGLVVQIKYQNLEVGTSDSLLMRVLS